MAGTASNVLVGAPATISLGPYVTAKGAATFSDIGFTIAGGVTLDPKVELHYVEVDQKLGQLAGIPKKRELELKFRMAEATLDNLRLVLSQPTSNLTGTTPNYQLHLDASAPEQYYQAKIVGKGLGTNAVRTVTLWKVTPKNQGAWMFKKDDYQMPEVTFHVFEETTGTGTNSWGQAFDT